MAFLIGVPGLAKTLMINTTAKVQGYLLKLFTPDMPSDIIGEILNENRQFQFIKVFSNIVADEIVL